MGMIASVIGKKNIVAIEGGLADALKAVEAAEAKIDPFLAKVAPVLPTVLAKLVALSPELSAVVTPAEIAEFAAGVGALPGAFKAVEAALTSAETEVSKL